MDPRWLGSDPGPNDGLANLTENPRPEPISVRSMGRVGRGNITRDDERRYR